jgi:hypothetical protein
MELSPIHTTSGRYATSICNSYLYKKETKKYEMTSMMCTPKVGFKQPVFVNGYIHNKQTNKHEKTTAMYVPNLGLMPPAFGNSYLYK